MRSARGHRISEVPGSEYSVMVYTYRDKCILNVAIPPSSRPSGIVSEIREELEIQEAEGYSDQTVLWDCIPYNNPEDFFRALSNFFGGNLT